jgi:FkbM family methyltransferase
MKWPARAVRRIVRDLKKYSRLRQARHEGLVFVEPNFIYRPDLSEDSVVIDAGCSYQADFSLSLMKRHGVRAFGIDPTRKHQDALERIAGQHPGRFSHMPWAIAAADGTLTFHESRINESGSLFEDHVNVLSDDTTRYDVEAVSLGTLISRLHLERVDILKLDLEGAEYDLLERLTARDLEPFRQLFIEFHHHAVQHVDEADTRRLVKRVADFGWRTFSIDDHNYLFYRASA